MAVSVHVEIGFPSSSRRQILAALPAVAGAGLLPMPAFAKGVAPLRFSVVGDWGRDGADWQSEVAAAMKKVAVSPGSEFVVSTGDNFYKFGVQSPHDTQWDTSFERIYDESLGRWYVVLGNHDWGGRIGAQLDRTCRSNRWTLPELWHDLWIRRPGLPAVHLIFIDTVTWIRDEGWFWSRLGDSPNISQQLRQRDWLERKLGEPADMKMVFGHHPILSIGPHGGERQMNELDELLRSSSVAAYVCGHDHCLYHITQGPMHYICSGAGSQMLPGYKGGPTPGCVLKAECADQHSPKWHAFFASVPDPYYSLDGGFAHFEVTGEGAGFSFYDGHGRRRYCALFAQFTPRMPAVAG